MTLTALFQRQIGENSKNLALTFHPLYTSHKPLGTNLDPKGTLLVHG